VPKIIASLDGALRPTERFFALIACVLVMVLMAVVCAEVLGRSAFNRPIGGVLDFVSQLMAPLVALGIAYCRASSAMSA
jgi:TRAP-type C4-dicarboxylate transport system permease small subunit